MEGEIEGVGGNGWVAPVNDSDREGFPIVLSSLDTKFSEEEGSTGVEEDDCSSSLFPPFPAA